MQNIHSLSNYIIITIENRSETKQKQKQNDTQTFYKKCKIISTTCVFSETKKNSSKQQYLKMYLYFAQSHHAQINTQPFLFIFSVKKVRKFIHKLIMTRKRKIKMNMLDRVFSFSPLSECLWTSEKKLFVFIFVEGIYFFCSIKK